MPPSGWRGLSGKQAESTWVHVAAAVRAERFKAQEAARQAAEARARESRPQTRAARAKVLREKRENKREGVLH